MPFHETSDPKELVLTGAFAEVKESDLSVCNLLGVVKNSSGKLRLILELRYVHLRITKFKYDDIRTACDLFSKGVCFFKFDHKSGYHMHIVHIDIFLDNTNFMVI